MKSFINAISIAIPLVFIVSCSGFDRMPSPSSYSVSSSPDLIEQSLFTSSDQTISEDDIQRLLNGTIKVTDSVRLAIFNYTDHSRSNTYSNYYYRPGDEEFLKTQQDYIETLNNAINASNKIQKTILMPSLMANKQSSITNLRETAVRLQADLLLVYCIKSDIYYKYKTFKADEAKAFATIECFLMDIRTGVIPFTTITTKESYLKKSSEEFSIDELRRKSEKTAVLEALESIGLEIKQYLENN